MKPDIQRELQESSDLSQDLVSLMGVGLTEKQSKETLEVVPDIQKALVIAEHYKNYAKGDFFNYNAFLEGVRTAILGPDQARSLYEQEVSERTTGIPPEILTRTYYRDTPFMSSHYYEHLASRRGE